MRKPVQAKLDAAAAWLDRGLPAGSSWIRAARADAAARVRASGLPVRRDEYWRYSNPARLTDIATPAGFDAEDDSAFAALGRLQLVFSGGRFNASRSGEAAEVATLAEAAAADIHWVKDLYGVLEARGQKPVERPLAALNTALAQDGAVIRIAGRAARPIELVYEAKSEASDAFLHHVIRLDPGAELTLIETGTPAARSNIVIEVEIGAGATLHHLRTQSPEADRVGASHIFARLGEGAKFKTFTLGAGGTVTRNEVVIELLGDHGSAHVAGIAMGGKGVLHDDTVFLTHEGFGCESRQVFKKVLRSGAQGVFQGKILVKQGAQKTDGYQKSQSLLLDDDAVFLAKPELEIYADDVKCSHGSTSGAIDETALYYLRSRGLPKDEAEHLLVQAFLAEALDEIDDPVLAEAVLGKLVGWLETLA